MKFLDIEEIERKTPAPRPESDEAPELSKPSGIVALTGADGRKVFVATAAISAVWETEGVQKSQGCGAMIYFSAAAGGCAGVTVRESHEEVIAAWRMALGLKGGVQ